MKITQKVLKKTKQNKARWLTESLHLYIYANCKLVKVINMQNELLKIITTSIIKY